MKLAWNKYQNVSKLLNIYIYDIAALSQYNLFILNIFS